MQCKANLEVANSDTCIFVSMGGISDNNTSIEPTLVLRGIYFMVLLSSLAVNFQ